MYSVHVCMCNTYNVHVQHILRIQGECLLYSFLIDVEIHVVFCECVCSVVKQFNHSVGD